MAAAIDCARPGWPLLETVDAKLEKDGTRRATKPPRARAIAAERASGERDERGSWNLGERLVVLEDESRFDLCVTRDWEMWWCDTEDHPENN